TGTGPSARAASSAHAELVHDDLADAAGVGLAAGGLHDRADEGADRLDLAALDLRDHVGGVGDPLVAGAAELRVVGAYAQTLGLDDRGGVAVAVAALHEHLLGDLVVDLLPVHQALQLGDLRRGDSERGELGVAVLGDAGQLAHPPLAGALRGGAHSDGRLDEVQGVGVDRVAHLQVGQAPLPLQAAATGGGQLRQRGADLLDPLPARGHRHQVRLGEVAVVLRVGLRAARGGAAGVLVEVAGLLDHLLPRVEHARLAGDLVPHRPLDRAEGVDVLGLGAGAERGARILAQRDVDVGADVAALHPRLGDVQRAEDVAQGAHVRGGDLGGAPLRVRDRLGDDLDQRHAGAAVVDLGVGRAVDAPGRAADGGVLAGVLLHVGALDLHPDDLAVVQLDVDPPVEGDGLVVLRGLEVLGEVRVEVLLAREAAGLGDRAVQREADADRVLHRP